MVVISKTFDFDAAHSLDFLPEGHKCRNTHGHTYRCEIRLRGDVPDSGMLLDYAAIADAWAPVHAALDHKHLNVDAPWVGNPTTENLARWIFEQLRPKFNLGLYLGVRLYESSTTYAEVGWA